MPIKIIFVKVNFFYNLNLKIVIKVVLLVQIIQLTNVPYVKKIIY